MKRAAPHGSRRFGSLGHSSGDFRIWRVSRRTGPPEPHGESHTREDKTRLLVIPPLGCLRVRYGSRRTRNGMTAALGETGLGIRVGFLGGLPAVIALALGIFHAAMGWRSRLTGLLLLATGAFLNLFVSDEIFGPFFFVVPQGGVIGIALGKSWICCTLCLQLSRVSSTKAVRTIGGIHEDQQHLCM